jgi:hypothetical protein
MNEKELWERTVKVDFAKENPDRIQARQDAETDSVEDMDE